MKVTKLVVVKGNRVFVVNPYKGENAQTVAQAILTYDAKYAGNGRVIAGSYSWDGYVVNK